MRRYFIIFLSTFLILIDQLSKYLIRHAGGFYICNPGIAFSVKIPLPIFISFWIIIVVFIGFSIFNFKFSIFNKVPIYKFSNLQTFGLLLILSGAVSNLVDRMHFGCVVDFINMRFWPIFNIADSFIVVGVIIILIKIRRNSFIH